jgi:hypothetical protein
MNEIELELAARMYAQQIMFTVRFNVPAQGLEPEETDRFYTPIHDQLVAAFIAGHRVANPKEAA